MLPGLSRITGGMRKQDWIFYGLFAVVVTVLAASAVVLYQRWSSLGYTQSELRFQAEDPRWNWAVINDRRSCDQRGSFRVCTSHLTTYDGAFGPERKKLVAWVCSARSCAWVFEP